MHNFSLLKEVGRSRLPVLLKRGFSATIYDLIMPVARISNIIEYAGNYYILKVEDKHGGSTKSLNEVRADIEKKLVQEEAQAIQEKWLASLRQKAYIKTF